MATTGKSTIGEVVNVATTKLVCTRGQNTWVTYDREIEARETGGQEVVVAAFFR